MIRGIHHVAINCHDINRMTKFYKDAFGFEIVGDGFDWHNAELIDQIIDVPGGSTARGHMMRAGTCYIELFQYSAPEPISTRALRPFDKGYTHFCVDVTDIEQEYTRLLGLGMTFGHSAPLDAGHVMTIYGRDPEGNIIEIQETRDACDFRLDKLPPVAK